MLPQSYVQTISPQRESIPSIGNNTTCYSSINSPISETLLDMHGLFVPFYAEQLVLAQYNHRYKVNTALFGRWITGMKKEAP